MPIPATAVAIGRLFLTDDSNTRNALDLIAVDPGRQFTFALLGFIANQVAPSRDGWRGIISML